MTFNAKPASHRSLSIFPWRRSRVLDPEPFHHESIVFVYHHFEPFLSGVGSYIKTYAAEFQRRGYQVTVIASNTDRLPFYENRNGIEVYRLKAGSLLLPQFRFPFPYSFAEWKRVYRSVFRKRNPLVMINTRFSAFSMMAIMMGWLSGNRNRCFIIEHGSAHLSFPQNRFLEFCIQWYEHLVTLLLRQFRPHFFAISSISAQWLCHFRIRCSGILSNGIDLHLPSEREPYRLLPEWNQKKIILYAGRLIEEKGVKELVQAFSQFSKSHQDYLLLLAGDGDLTEYVRSQAEEIPGILPIGYLTQNELIDVMLQSFVLVLPSKFIEGVPTIILEAGLCKLPVISSNSGGLIHMIIHDHTGLALPRVEVQEVSDLLEYAVSHESSLKTYSRNLYALIEKQYDIRHLVDRFLCQLEEI